MLYHLVCAFYLICSLVGAYVHSTKTRKRDFITKEYSGTSLSLARVFLLVKLHLAQGISFATYTQNKTGIVLSM